jgi:hypothetical protein
MIARLGVNEAQRNLANNESGFSLRPAFLSSSLKRFMFIDAGRRLQGLHHFFWPRKPKGCLVRQKGGIFIFDDLNIRWL